MIKRIIIFIIAAAVGLAGFLFWLNFFNPQNKQIACTMEAKLCPDGSAVGRSGPNCQFAPCPQTDTNVNQNPAVSPIAPNSLVFTANGLAMPISRALERVTKKPFGIYITPKNSPVQPEKFSGYHTGADFEILENETDLEVAVFAICSGSLAVKQSANGYGGVVAQNCIIAEQDAVVVYGHLNLESITAKVGQQLSAGQVIGVLGQGYSIQTSGERKHLHLSISKGSSIDIRGYVQNQSELANWLDPVEILSY
jgi:murein DD-endopeptidase MepM/ murein hydrolase activator NlpD